MPKRRSLPESTIPKDNCSHEMIRKDVCRFWSRHFGDQRLHLERDCMMNDLRLVFTQWLSPLKP